MLTGVPVMKLLANRPAIGVVDAYKYLGNSLMTDPCLHLDVHAIAEYLFMYMEG
ncbi:hypothetical protein D3C84_1300080 [compost metagenome]